MTLYVKLYSSNRAMVMGGGPLHFSEKQDERFLKSVLVWTSSTDM
jgi:hypothetical protein